MEYDITIRGIQHYLYCPHRWGLLEIGKMWAENAFVVKGNLLHERVHDSDNKYSIRGKKVYTSVSVYNDLPDYGIYGVTDCIEFSKEGECCIVEYKPTMPKDAVFNDDDAMQVFAQKICVDYIFNTNCKAVLYYADVKKRILLTFDNEYSDYDMRLKETLSKMRSYYEKGIIPPISTNQKCNGCSMKDLCMPKSNKSINVRDNIFDAIGSEI